MKPSSHRRARYSAVLVGVLVVALVIVLATRRTAPGTMTESSLGGKLAPPVSGVALNSGKTVSLRALRGRFVVLDFFASWCTPCLAEVPQLSRFVFQHKGANAATVLGIDIDDSAADGRAFLARVGATWPAIEDANAMLAQAYGVASPPRAFLISPAGRVVATFSSGVTTDQLDAVLAAASVH